MVKKVCKLTVAVCARKPLSDALAKALCQMGAKAMVAAEAAKSFARANDNHKHLDRHATPSGSR